MPLKHISNISQSKQKLIVYVILTVITFAVFWQVNRYDFINLDDQLYVKQNSYIRPGITLEGIHWAFGNIYYVLWHPLVWISFMLDYHFYGLNAGGYHVTNLLLHILSTLLLFWLFNRMTKEIWPSAFVAAFFALHPLHVESVAWISERKDVLSAFFWMLTLCLYVYYTEKPTVKRYILVLFSFMCALMSKTIAVTLPVIMILLDYWPLSRFRIGIKSQKTPLILWQLKEKFLFIILSLAIVFITFYNQNNDFLYYKPLPLELRLANAPVSFVNYLVQTFWPHDMSILYPYPYPSQIFIWQVIGASLLIIIISSFVFLMVRRMPYLFVGWLWYTATILPAIMIVLFGTYAMADRYHYLPSIGIAVMLAWGIPLLFPGKESTSKIILFSSTIVFLSILTFLSWQQCQHWENSIKLFRHSLQVTKNNTRAHNLIGYSLFEKGNLSEAIYHYNKAILITPDYFYAYDNRGHAYAKLGQYQRACEDFTMVVSLKKDYFEGYYNRGTFYGKILGQYKLAIDDFNEVIRLKPDYIEAYNKRGLSYYNVGKYQPAIEDFNKAISMKPDYADAYNNRGLAFFNQGKKELGCKDALKACNLGNCKALDLAKTKGLCR